MAKNEVAEALRDVFAVPSEIAEALRDAFVSPNEQDSNWESANLVDVVDRLASVLRFGFKSLGLNDAATPMGAIEAHAVAIKEGSELIAEAIIHLAEVIGDKQWPHQP
jgi:hypothetical protein